MLDIIERSKKIKIAYEKICDNLESWKRQEDISYEIQSELSLYPQILELFPNKDDKIKAMIMLYTVNPRLYELNNWDLQTLKRYVYDTVEEKYIKKYEKIFKIIEKEK